jgi:hypothetical protein
LEFHSWQEHLLGPVEFGEETTPIALRAHDQGRSLQLLNRGLTVCHLPELNSMLAEWIFEFSEPKLHLQYLWNESFAEPNRLCG